MCVCASVGPVAVMGSEEIAKVDSAVVRIKIGSEVKNTATFTESIEIGRASCRERVCQYV